MHRPDPTEYAPYFGKYITLVQGNDAVAALDSQLKETLSFLGGLSDAQGDLRYAPDKWSIKEVIGHISDTERIFAYRALRFARHDRTPLSSFDENSYVAHSNLASRRLAEITEEFELVRKANLHFFKSLDGEMWVRRGIANENEASVRALAYMIAGHELHHLEIIRSRYL